MPTGRPPKVKIVEDHWPNEDLPFVIVDTTDGGFETRPLENVQWIETPREKWKKDPEGGWKIERVIVEEP